MLKDINVRFFMYDEDKNDLKEVKELDFLACEYPISYKRHTIFENGVSQICLTKIPTF